MNEQMECGAPAIGTIRKRTQQFSHLPLSFGIFGQIQRYGLWAYKKQCFLVIISNDARHFKRKDLKFVLGRFKRFEGSGCILICSTD